MYTDGTKFPYLVRSSEVVQSGDSKGRRATHQASSFGRATSCCWCSFFTLSQQGSIWSMQLIPELTCVFYSFVHVIIWRLYGYQCHNLFDAVGLWGPPYPTAGSAVSLFCLESEYQWGGPHILVVICDFVCCVSFADTLYTGVAKV